MRPEIQAIIDNMNLHDLFGADPKQELDKDPTCKESLQVKEPVKNTIDIVKEPVKTKLTIAERKAKIGQFILDVRELRDKKRKARMSEPREVNNGL